MLLVYTRKHMQDDTQQSDYTSKQDVPEADGEEEEDATDNPEIPSWMQRDLDWMAGTWDFQLPDGCSEEQPTVRVPRNDVRAEMQLSRAITDSTEVSKTVAVRETALAQQVPKHSRKDDHRYDPPVVYMWSDQAQMAYRQVAGKTEWAIRMRDTPGPNMMKVAVFDDGVEWECAGVLFHRTEALPMKLTCTDQDETEAEKHEPEIKEDEPAATDGSAQHNLGKTKKHRKKSKTTNTCGECLSEDQQVETVPSTSTTNLHFEVACPPAKKLKPATCIQNLSPNASEQKQQGKVAKGQGKDQRDGKGKGTGKGQGKLQGKDTAKAQSKAQVQGNDVTPQKAPAQGAKRGHGQTYRALQYYILQRPAGVSCKERMVQWQSMSASEKENYTLTTKKERGH